MIEEDLLEETPNSILFHKQDIDFVLPDEERIATWIQQTITAEKHQLSQVNYIFCSDEYLHKINMEYLKHDTYTDIITFPYAESPLVESDIFISIDRIKENAITFETSFTHELLRVLIHGVLHLCGYGDKTAEEKKVMREKEDACVLRYGDISRTELLDC